MFHRRAIVVILWTLFSGDQISNVVAFSKCSLKSSTAFRLSTTELFNLKSSQNGSSMSRKKMMQMRRKGKFDIYVEEGSSSSEMMALDDTESSSSCAVAGVHDRVVDEHTTRGSRAEVAKLKRSKQRTKGSSKGTNDNVDASSDDDDDNSESRNSGLSQVEYLKLLDSRPALVLNADYQPLSHIPLSLWCWQDSVKAVFSGRVTVVDTYPDITVRGIGIEMPVPSVIALNEYIPQASKKNPAFTRRNVFLRDGYRCQYCNNMFKGHELSLDHVIPKCLGGTLRWDNTVSACKKCNGRKSSLLPSELKRVGMRLLREPKVPSMYELNQSAGRILLPRNVHPTWAPYLGLDINWNTKMRPRGGKSSTNEKESSI